MEWMKAEKIHISVSKKLTLEQVERKYVELQNVGFTNTPPVEIDEKNEIVDGVKRYLVLVKEGFEDIPVRRYKKTDKFRFSKTIVNPLKIAA